MVVLRSTADGLAGLVPAVGSPLRSASCGRECPLLGALWVGCGCALAGHWAYHSRPSDPELHPLSMQKEGVLVRVHVVNGSIRVCAHTYSKSTGTGLNEWIKRGERMPAHCFTCCTIF